jgi:hypothetical protein
MCTSCGTSMAVLIRDVILETAVLVSIPFFYGLGRDLHSPGLGLDTLGLGLGLERLVSNIFRDLIICLMIHHCVLSSPCTLSLTLRLCVSNTYL